MLRLVTVCALVALTLAEETLTLNQAAKDKFLELHNKYRKDTGASMADLVWSDTLAEAAAAASSKCEFAHTANSPYGENIYITSQNADGEMAATGASDAWYQEINNVDDVWDCIANNPSNTCGHYSQEIWAETTELGCAVTQGCLFPDWGMTATMVFCEYSPAGNMMQGYDFDNQKWIPNEPYRK